MKKLFSRTFGSIRKRVMTAAILGVAVVFPIAASAANTVKMQATTTVANATKDAGSTTAWSGSTSAKYNEVVAVQVIYNNKEEAGSNKNATNVRVKINIPSTAGKTQTITTTTKADNSNKVSGSATVNLDRADAYLQYIPGTATWKHATVDNADINGTKNIVTQKVSDDVVLGANGINLGTEKPCQAGSIVIQARVMVPGLTVDKYVRVKGQTEWNRSISAKIGDTLEYAIAYKNTGNTTQNDVAFRDQLPKGVQYVPGSTVLKNSNYPSGKAVTSDALVASNGITVGDYAPSAAAYVYFQVKLTGNDLKCGENTVRNLAFVQPTGMNYYYNTADVVTTKECETKPVYSCDQFTLTADKNRTVTVKSFKYTAKDGATFNNVVINWGDKSDALTTNTPVGKTHKYAKDGDYTVTATAHFTVDGKSVTSVGNCTQKVSFTAPGTIKVCKLDTKEIVVIDEDDFDSSVYTKDLSKCEVMPPEELPNTGAGNMIGLFAGVTVAGALAHRFMSRRTVRG